MLVWLMWWVSRVGSGSVAGGIDLQGWESLDVLHPNSETFPLFPSRKAVLMFAWLMWHGRGGSRGWGGGGPFQFQAVHIYGCGKTYMCSTKTQKRSHCFLPLKWFWCWSHTRCKYITWKFAWLAKLAERRVFLWWGSDSDQDPWRWGKRETYTYHYTWSPPAWFLHEDGPLQEPF